MKNKFPLLIILGLLPLLIQVSCKSAIKSPDGRYEAERLEIRTVTSSLLHYFGGEPSRDEQEIKCVVKEIETQYTIAMSDAKHDDRPNDAIACQFSPDSKKFAAYYHYGNDAKSGYTWIGVWDLESVICRPKNDELKGCFSFGDGFLYAIEEPGWLKHPLKEFPQKR